MNLSADDLVLQIGANQPGNTLPQSMRDTLGLIERLGVEKAEFEMADVVNGLRTGVLSSFTVIRRMPPGDDVDARIRESLLPVLEVLGLPSSAFGVEPYDCPGNPLVGDVDVRRDQRHGAGPYGVFSVCLGVGVDPFNPEGEEGDYSEDAEELVP
jgi:hypothetical protein